MSGAVGRTSSLALCNATFPYVRELSGDGLEAFLARSPGHAVCLNMRDGRLEHEGVKAAYPDLV